MATKSLRYEGLPEVAIVEGALTPDPGIPGVRVWSTSLSRVMFWDGSRWASLQPAITISSTPPTSPFIGQLWYDIS